MDYKIRLDLGDGDYLKIVSIGNNAKVILKSGNDKVSKVTSTENIDQIKDPLALHSYVDAVFYNKDTYPLAVTERNTVTGLKVDNKIVKCIESIKVDNIKNNLYDLTVKFKGVEHE